LETKKALLEEAQERLNGFARDKLKKSLSKNPDLKVFYESNDYEKNIVLKKNTRL
jgi:hypothetical protein